MQESEEDEVFHKPKAEDLSKFFIDREGNPFDPNRIFGSIEDSG